MKYQESIPSLPLAGFIKCFWSIEQEAVDAALDLRYHDQSPMIRDFNEFAGTSPLNYFVEAHRLSELFTASV